MWLERQKYKNEGTAGHYKTKKHETQDHKNRKLKRLFSKRENVCKNP